MYLEVRERQGESGCSNSWAVREARVLLFGFGPEPQPSQHRVELVAQAPVSTNPSARIERARVRMIAFRVEPAAPPTRPSRAAPATRITLGLEWQSQTEPC